MYLAASPARRRPWFFLITSLLAACASQNQPSATAAQGSVAINASPPIAALQSDRWIPIAPPPISSRNSGALQWDGQELLMWGGQDDATGNTLADGAAFNPRTNRWRMLPTSPLSDRVVSAAAWTGNAWFIGGGARVLPSRAWQGLFDAALNYPSTNSWTLLPPAPIPAQEGSALWTGREIWTSNYADLNQSDLIEGYNPTTDTWRRVPIPPYPAAERVEGLTLAKGGSDIYAFESWDFGMNIFAYSYATDSWKAVSLEGSNADPELPGIGMAPNEPYGVGSAYWTGHDFLTFHDSPYAPGAGGNGLSPTPTPDHGVLWDPTTNNWTPLADSPAEGFVAWTGEALILGGTEPIPSNGVFGTSTPAPASQQLDISHYQQGIPIFGLDPTRKSWDSLPALPAPVKYVLGAVWAGDRLIVAGDYGGWILGP